MKIIASLFVVLYSLASFGQTHIARIVSLESTSEVYIPGENKQESYKHVKYLDEVYHVVPAKKGMKLDNGYILATGPFSKAKVIFKNGDHFYVSENTQYRINWKAVDEGKKEDSSVIYLIRGAIRGMIQKDGPRSGLKVKVQNAVMGVRGTDFFVTENRGDLNVTVLRGEVEIINQNNKIKPITVKTGETLIVKNKVPKISITTKEDLGQIAKTSALIVSPVDKSSEDTKELAVLEENAVKITVNDIKEYQPLIYKELIENKKASELSSDSLALNTVKILEVKAPSKAKKPSEAELNGGQDPYDKYKFNKDEQE